MRKLKINTERKNKKFGFESFQSELAQTFENRGMLHCCE